MITKVNKWGNSLALRIPMSFANELNLTENSSMDLKILDGTLSAKPIESDVRKKIEDRFKAFEKNGEKISGEIDFGAPIGDEVW